MYSFPARTAQYALPSWEEVKNIHCAPEIAFYDVVAGSESSLYVFYKVCKWRRKTFGRHYRALRCWPRSQSRHNDFTPVIYAGKTPRSSCEEALQRDSLCSSPSRLCSTRGTFISPTVWFLIRKARRADIHNSVSRKPACSKDLSEMRCTDYVSHFMCLVSTWILIKSEKTCLTYDSLTFIFSPRGSQEWKISQFSETREQLKSTPHKLKFHRDKPIRDCC